MLSFLGVLALLVAAAPRYLSSSPSNEIRFPPPLGFLPLSVGGQQGFRRSTRGRGRRRGDAESEQIVGYGLSVVDQGRGVRRGETRAVDVWRVGGSFISEGN